MHKSKKRLIIMSIVSVLLIIGFIPKISEKTITENSEYVLNTHHYSKISEYGDYSALFNQRDYIVRNNITNEIDTLGVTSVRGQLLLSEKIEVKKNRIKNIFF